MSKYVWTSEYVSPGHPDKIADQISDAVLDAYLSKDPNSKVACEVMVKDTDVYVAGEITSTASLSKVDLTGIVRKTICDIGYTTKEIGFNGYTCNIHFNLSAQSPEINGAVDKGEITTAGDQGIMFGFATRETPNGMPIPIYLAKKLIDVAYKLVKNHYKNEDILRPDMKSQVSIVFENGRAVSVDNVVMSMCHSEKINLERLQTMFHSMILPEVFREIPSSLRSLFTKNTRYFINPAGEWNIGGPISDCGLTGRKIVVDQYGADCEIGGGAFSGKDPSKVDRSAAYMARYIAKKTLNENPEAKKIKVQLAYAIGEEYPVSYRIYDPTTGKEYGLGNLTEQDLTPSKIIERLKLKTPIYLQTAKKGHFGNNEFEWEKIGEA
jgi:S-adenosylmethionine synthetase